MKSGSIKVTIIATGFNGAAIKKTTSQLTDLFSVSTDKKQDAPEEAGFSPKGREPSKGEVKKSPRPRPQQKSDAWDIPTFLRRKKK